MGILKVVGNLKLKKKERRSSMFFKLKLKKATRIFKFVL